MRRRPERGLAIGLVLSLALLLAAGLSLLWTPWPVQEIDLAAKLKGPSAAHWLGTDSLGRDVASLLLAGAQVSLLVGVIAVAIGLVLGVALGLLAAARGGWVEEVIMRAADLGFAFPAILTALLIAAVWGPGIVGAIVAIGLHNVPTFARVARNGAHAAWARDYCLAARACGKSALAISLQHVLPNIAPLLIVQATIQFALAILAEAALSFLGLGTQAPQASWGRMLAEAQTQLFNAPLLAVFPGLAIMLAVLGLNLLGDGLRDLSDPKRRGARR
ncbi:ABC transporter permease [Roseateles violae]|uniref:ABC transporter permease n=1 Tax=Roseateles violae TaxID=3058042 RepID=A0ABT8DM31_9BURK|nr:ABC transporter permease [Pelomonas sp. PFR6]MDN3919464.1 ABC transporter permease [Pelomonas sp. PFR6]